MISFFRNLTITKNAKVSDKEAVFYQKLFIENSRWNSPSPNEEELIRWIAINSLIESNINFNDGSSRILDLGCGRGWMTKLLNGYGEAIGYEPVHRVVDYARSLFPDIGFYVGNFHDAAKEQGRNVFDLVVSSEVIEHIPDDEKGDFALSISSMLNSNGYLIITTPRAEVYDQFMTYSNANQPVEQWMSESDVLNLFVSFGFSALTKTRINQKFNEANSLDLYQVWVFQKKQ